MPFGWLTLLFAMSARADVARHALVVGHNVGNADEVPLLYAEDDAARVARVLVSTGGAGEPRTQVLQGPTRNQLLHAFADLRLAVEADHAAGDDTLVVFFYSGHADANGIHLNGSACGRVVQRCPRSSPCPLSDISTRLKAGSVSMYFTCWQGEALPSALLLPWGPGSPMPRGNCRCG